MINKSQYISCTELFIFKKMLIRRSVLHFIVLSLMKFYMNMKVLFYPQRKARTVIAILVRERNSLNFQFPSHGKVMGPMNMD